MTDTLCKCVNAVLECTVDAKNCRIRKSIEDGWWVVGAQTSKGLGEQISINFTLLVSALHQHLRPLITASRWNAEIAPKLTAVRADIDRSFIAEGGGSTARDALITSLAEKYSLSNEEFNRVKTALQDFDATAQGGCHVGFCHDIVEYQSPSSPTSEGKRRTVFTICATNGKHIAWAVSKELANTIVEAVNRGDKNE